MVFNMPPMNTPGSGAVNLGSATGALRIDLSDLKNAVGMVRQSVQSINGQMSQIGKGASASLQQVRQEIQKIQGPLTALTVAGAGFIALGLKSADNLKAARIQLSGMLGGMDKANALIKNLQDEALKTGKGFGSILTATRLLLPTLENNTEELDRYLGIAIRLSVLNPTQGIEGAAFAINEFVSSGGRDIVSLAERFNLPKAKIRELMAETGDAGDALDSYLTKLGITEETVAEMGDTMTVSMQKARSLVTQIAGTAFQPMLENAVIPLLQKFSEFLVKLSEVNPKVLGLAGSVIALATAGGAALLAFAKLAKTLEAIKSLSIASKLGPVGLAGLAAYGGVELGLGVTRAIGKAQGNEELANADWSTLTDKLKQIVVLFAGMLQPAGKALGDLAGIAIAAGAYMKAGFGRVVEALASFVTGIGDALHIQALQDAGAAMQEWADGLKLTNEERAEVAQRMQDVSNKLEQFGKSMGETIAQALYPAEQAGAGGGEGAPEMADINAFTADQIAAWGEFQADLKQIETDAQQDRLKATEDFEKQRAEVEADYQKTLRRMDEDNGIQDRRTAASRAKQMAGVTQNLQDQVEELAQTHQERLASIQEEAHKQDIQAQEDHQRRRRELQQELADQLLSSARRLDALGVINAIQNYTKQSRAENDNFNDAQQERATQMAERLEQEQQSHEERLQAARDAATIRLDELRAQYAEEDRLLQEDRALRLQRMEEDHREQLAVMERAQLDRLAQIDNQVAQERAAREKAFIEQINALGGHEGQMLSIQEEGQAAMEGALRTWWNRQQQMINDARKTAEEEANRREQERWQNNYPSFQTGGAITRTGLYRLHAGEEVLKPDVASFVRHMMGGSINQDALVGAMTGAGAGTQVGTINMPIYAAEGQSPQEIARYAVDELIKQLKGL
jgi:hypothetical protein